MDTPSLKVFKTRMDGALSSLFIPVNLIFFFPLKSFVLFLNRPYFVIKLDEFAEKKKSCLSSGDEIRE